MLERFVQGPFGCGLFFDFGDIIEYLVSVVKSRLRAKCVRGWFGWLTKGWLMNGETASGTEYSVFSSVAVGGGKPYSLARIRSACCANGISILILRESRGNESR